MTFVRVAAIDCGTNSIRLLVTDVDAVSGKQIDVDRRMEIVRLGQGVDQTGRIDPTALARTLEALQRYADLIRDLNADRVRMVATSATRDASNRAEFAAGVNAILGVPPEVVSGDGEARLSYAGATRGLPGDCRPPYLVVDIGGGSTEFVLGNHEPRACASVDIGCVRMTERHLHGDPPTAEQVAAARADIEAAIDRAAEIVPIKEAHTLVGLAGSVTTVAGISLGLPSYDPDSIHLSRVPASAVRTISDDLLAATHAERAAIPVMHSGRVDVIAAGALVLRAIVDRLALPEVVVSEHDILDGIAWALV